ncbi:MAG: universal stress protein [Thermoanaerobaculia bacterium]|nr:universal stress protein [Thermoanaerobaculia bacterium]
MKEFKNILVATDTRLEGHPILDEAVEIARFSGATLKIVDVVPDFPWTVRLTVKKHEDLRALVQREKKASLDALAAPIRERGIQVEAKVLSGRTSVEIVREVLRYKHDLVLRVAKGVDSRRGGYFGTTGIRLLRECPCAVWLVAPAATHEYQHVMGCVDTSAGDSLDAELNDKVYRLASLMSRHHDAQLSIVHAWLVFGEQLLRNRVSPIEFERMIGKSRDQIEEQFDEFLRKHGSGVGEPNVHLVRGDPSSVIPTYIAENGVDLVVLGTVARSYASGMLIGNTAERILNSIQCSVLALKPDRFVSPIKLGDYIDLAGD